MDDKAGINEAQDRARLSLVEAAIRLEDAGLNRGSTGNIGTRFGDEILVTPSGVPVRDLTPESMVLLGWDGGKVDEGQPERPTSEWRFHRDILATRAEFGAVVHCHAPHTTALACLGRDLPAFHYMVAVAGGIDIRCTPYALFGSQELSDLVLEALEGRKACLMANHGMIACDTTIERAIALAIEVEALAGIYLAALQVGTPNILSADEMAEVLAKFRDSGYGRQAR